MHRSFLIALALLAACDDPSKDPGKDTDEPRNWECVIPSGESPDFAEQLGCQADYDALASQPADASIPGATSVKTVIDRVDQNHLYFMNSQRYCIHWDFASQHLSGNGLPIVPDMSSFNATEYYSPDRRFLLGALSYYEGPGKLVYEISPYDTSDADMIATAYRKIKENLWLGEELLFHPTSEAVELVAASLPSDVKQISTDELYAGIDYQPLNLGTTTGLLSFRNAADIESDPPAFRELVVLDAVPNDISIVAGIITSEFQTPLAHINVLSVNRGTPNMGLRGAAENEELRALEGKWVELTVGAFDWSVREITADEADAWWDANKPEALVVQPRNVAVTELPSLDDIIDLEASSLADAISNAIPIYGAKATNYAALMEANELGEPIPIQPGFAIPMYYYDQFMTDNDLWARIEEIMAVPEWDDPNYRAEALEAFKDEMRDMPMRPEVVDMIKARAAEIFPGENIRFRSSTNAEDLGLFTGAGLYNSETGHPTVDGDGRDSVEWAVKKVWSQVWNPRAYEEREYYSMNHMDVGMALLVHANFPEEEANGVAITNNPYDTTGLEPGFYVNAQEGSEDVVAPEPGIFADAYLHYYYSPGQPIVYIQHSNLVPAGETVLTTTESYELATALAAIHSFFYETYGAGESWYAMDVEWKFDDKYTPGDAQLWIKQARPYPGWSSDATGACGTSE